MSCLPVPAEIPDGEILYRYCNPKAFPEDQIDIPLTIFNDPDLSCDWERYQKAPFSSVQIQYGKSWVIQISVCDAIRNPTNPERIGQVVPAWRQEIIHDPVQGANEAHSLIRGKKKGAVLEAIRDNALIYGIAPER